MPQRRRSSVYLFDYSDVTAAALMISVQRAISALTSTRR
jgi:hypothetical protein